MRLEVGSWKPGRIIISTAIWRGVRVVDCAVLERLSALKRSEGSNPSLSDFKNQL